MSNPQSYYMQHVFPHVPDDVKQSALYAHPDVQLTVDEDVTPLADCNLLMLVGLTGTGKSTTLNAMRELGGLDYVDAIPTRRELADLILIPAAQQHQNKALTSVKDREQRFAYTRYFQQNLATGGTAEAFTWLHYRQPETLTLSEGVRGANEIQYALDHTRWRIIELWVDPVTRLRRLSNRNDSFDAVASADTPDLSFLPDNRTNEVRVLLRDGEITPEAVVTVRAEAQNYGADPFDMSNQTANYQCFVMADQSPQQVAQEIVTWLKL